MSITVQNSKIIFGLKVKQLRRASGLSSTEVSKQAGLSLSYLNEIEKGKKTPKADKITNLARVLHTTYEDLVSSELNGNLAHVGELLHSNFLNELPLDLFGIELAKLVEIVAGSPLRVGAFISALVELARNYAFKEENFYFHALRAYQELNNNYFAEIEQQINAFIAQYNIPTERPVSVALLIQILETHYDYTVIEKDFEKMPPLKIMRSVFKATSRNLYLNKRLNDKQKALQLGKELAYNFLKLKERINTSYFLRVENFEKVLNNYFAGYFAVGILVYQPNLVQDLKAIFEQPTWQADAFLQLLEKYEVSPEVLFQRFNVLPSIFNIKKLFFLRISETEKNNFQIDKEMHLNRKHQPHANNLKEHYCRRWLSIRQLREVSEKTDKEQRPVVGIQRSKYMGTQDEYLCFTIARPSYFPSTKKVSVTIGLLIDEGLGKAIRFLENPNIPRQVVSVTCERCTIQDCQERAVPPTIVEKREERKAIKEALKELK